MPLDKVVNIAKAKTGVETNELHELIADFRDKIRTSTQIARDVDEFLASLELLSVIQNQRMTEDSVRKIETWLEKHCEFKACQEAPLFERIAEIEHQIAFEREHQDEEVEDSIAEIVDLLQYHVLTAPDIFLRKKVESLVGLVRRPAEKKNSETFRAYRALI